MAARGNAAADRPWRGGEGRSRAAESWPASRLASLTAPSPAAILAQGLCGSSSVVEHRLAKARVAGSSPVSRSSSNDAPACPFTLPAGSRRAGIALRSSNSIAARTPKRDSGSACLGLAEATAVLFHSMARYPSGKGEVCKTSMRRFDPDPRLQILSVTSTHPSPGLPHIPFTA